MTTRRQDAGDVALLIAILQGRPNLRGAACVAAPGLFDPRRPDEDADETEYRHTAAVSMCRSCPALEACRAHADTQPTTRAVIAARLPRRSGRPTKETAVA
ncbi:transcriptional regulator [Gordonia alkanivorans]|uniref:transcriptional regulator n=1 Tax=Gordonia alkanivorans TaxID=84096 RepID=UPI001F4E72C8|nr:transcriptional regulator [Gordonia alkanivorans]MDH3026833.1 transcriptional regulator [Gordonia alkanivorans]